MQDGFVGQIPLYKSAQLTYTKIHRISLFSSSPIESTSLNGLDTKTKAITVSFTAKKYISCIKEKFRHHIDIVHNEWIYCVRLGRTASFFFIIIVFL